MKGAENGDGLVGRQLVDDDWPAMGMKMGFTGNQKK